MAAYNKFDAFTDYIIGNVPGQVIAFDTDTFKYLLTNTAPVATDAKYSDVSAGEVANGNGYTTGGEASVTIAANASGTETVTVTSVSWTASVGSIGPFRYVIYYDDTPSDKPLVAWWDYGSSQTLTVGQALAVYPNSSLTTGTLFTLV